MSGTPTGRFCWYELLTTDPGAARDFYGGVIGWGATDWAGGETPYTVWMAGERPIGGVMELPEDAKSAGAPPHWMPYVSTPDVAATTTKARALGAQVLVDGRSLPGVGTIAVMADPQGAVFTAFQPEGETPGHDGPADVGEFSWHELATTDWEAGWSFYSELFGWEKDEAMDMGPRGTYQVFNRGAHPLGGFFDKPDEMPVPAWVLYTRVEDVDAAAAAVKERGGTVINEPMEVPGGDRIAHFTDPQGAMFAVHQVVSGQMTG